MLDNLDSQKDTFAYTLQPYLQLTLDKIQQFAKSSGFSASMNKAFGKTDTNLQKSWSEGRFDLPEIVVTSQQIINGAYGAFASTTNTIYVAKEFLETNTLNTDAIVRLLLQEYGHFIDHSINSFDSPGDEGEIFAALVLGESLDESTLLQLQTKDDTATIFLNNQILEIEQGGAVPGGGGDDEPEEIIGDSGNNDLSANIPAGKNLSILGFAGNDTLTGGFSNDRLVGLDGSDILSGVLSGTASNKEQAGKDRMLGGQGADLFILGVNDWDKPFYDDGDITQPGILHYTTIDDLNKDEDKIQLKGLPEDYILDTSPIPEKSGTGIFYKRNSEQVNELIAVITNLTPDNLNLAEKYFVYTKAKDEPSSNTISFKESKFQVKEDDTSTEPITLVRSSDSNKADVRLKLTDGTATSDDYDGSSIDISFAPGEKEKTVRVPINNDSDKEDDETINLSLESLSEEFVIGEQNEATLTIKDDDREGEKDDENLHAIYEFIAKDVAYKDYNVGDKIDGYDYKVDKVFNDENTGFFALGLISTTGKSPLLAIRGTEIKYEIITADILSVFNEDGIGFDQFEPNEGDVTDWLNSQEKPDITGHGLGGAIAQYFASKITERGDKLGNIVTFNSPGISGKEAERFRPENAEEVMHYISSGDIVSLAGEEFIDGDYTLVKFLEFNPTSKHTLPFLTEEVGYQKSEKIRKRPEKRDFSKPVPVNFLNSSFFAYVDLDYFTWILGAIATTSETEYEYIPPFLTFRNGVESLRKRLSEREFSTILATFDKVTPKETSLDDIPINVPEISFNFLNTINIQAKDLSVKYDESDKSYKLQGQASILGPINLNADFAGDNYIKVSRQSLPEIVGELSVDDIILVPNKFEIRNSRIRFDKGSIKAETEVLLPTGFSLEGKIGFLNKQFNEVALAIKENLDIPIFSTGFYLQTIEGEFKNLAPSSTPYELGAGGKLTWGSEKLKVKLNLPKWLGGEKTTTLMEVNFKGYISEEKISADKENTNINIFGDLIKGEAGAELNWNEGFLEAEYSFTVANFFTSEAKFRADNKLNFKLTGEATLVFPEVDLGLFKLQGADLASSKYVIQYTNDGDNSNDFIRASGALDIPVSGTVEAAIQVNFDGKVEQGIIFGNNLVETSSFTIDSQPEWIILNASWDNPSNKAAIYITKPDGTRVDESEFAANNIEIVESLISDTNKAVIVKNPEAGIWDINLVDTTGLGNFEYNGFINSKAPEIDITSLVPNETGSEITINYIAQDPDSNAYNPSSTNFDPYSEAKISFFYDNNNEGNDGIIIETGIPENDGNASYTWNTQGITPGEYYIYAMIVDGSNAPVFNYSQETVTITESADLVVNKSTSSEPVKVGDSFKYTIQVTNSGSVESQGVKLSETLPPEINLISTTPNFVSQSQNQLEFDLGNIAAGATEIIEITVTAPDSPKLLRSRTQVESQTFDPDKNNNVDITYTDVVTELPQTTSEASFSDNQIFDFGGNFGETKQLKFSLASQNSKSSSEIGVFAVDDAQGNINGIAPSNPEYLTTALENSRTIFSLLPNNILEGVDFTRQLNFDASQRLGFYLIQDSTADTVLADLNNGVEPGNVSFAISSANEANFAPLQVSQLEDESFQLAWRDAPDSSKENFLNLMLNMEVSDETSTSPGINLQDTKELIDLRNTTPLQASFSIASEAAYDNVVGWYRIDDESGSIGELKPGDSGYAQKAIGERSVVHFNRNGTQQPLQMEGLLAPYIIVNSTRELFLQNNPNLFGKQERAYFAFMEANPDKADHIRLLGDNTFGFEDLFNGGDKDYNDMILKVDLI